MVDLSQELTAEGITVSQLTVDIASNRLRIGVVDLDPGKHEVIQRLFVEVNVFDRPVNEVEPRSDTAITMLAGVRICSSSGDICTSNWKAQDRTTGELATITAGHCVVDVSGTLGGRAIHSGVSATTHRRDGMPLQWGIILADPQALKSSMAKRLWLFL